MTHGKRVTVIVQIGISCVLFVSLKVTYLDSCISADKTIKSNSLVTYDEMLWRSFQLGQFCNRRQA